MTTQKVVSEETVFSTDKFTIKKSLLRVNGEKRLHYDIWRNPVVAIFPLTDKNELYLISEYRYLFKKAVLGSVAGFIDKDEPPLKAAKRELQEETGLKAQKWKDLGVVDLARSVLKSQVHFFLAQDISQGDSNPEDDEEISVVKIPLKDAVEKVIKGEITTAASIIGILMIDKLLEKRKL